MGERVRPGMGAFLEGFAQERLADSGSLRGTKGGGPRG